MSEPNINEPQAPEIELVFRRNTEASEYPFILTSQDAYNQLMRSWDMDKIELQQQFKIMLMDRDQCIGISTLATGGVSCCPVDLKLAFATALKTRATGIILAHNYTSGELEPSEHDKMLTHQFTRAGILLDILVLDHLIVTKRGYKSFIDTGLMTPRLL